MLTKMAKDWLPSVVIAVVISLLVNVYVAQAVKVPTGSMMPTIQVNDRLVVEKMVALTHFDYGDIVVFHPLLKKWMSVSSKG